MKLLFLDIDGTLTTTISGNKFKQYPLDIAVLPGAAIAIKTAAFDSMIVGISNQGGIPFFKTHEDYLKEAMRTMELLPELTCIIYAPDKRDECRIIFNPSKGNSQIIYSDDFSSFQITSSFRKPGFGMLEFFFLHYPHLLLSEKLFIGDRPEDAECAMKANIPFVDAEVWRSAAVDYF